MHDSILIRFRSTTKSTGKIFALVFTGKLSNLKLFNFPFLFVFCHLFFVIILKGWQLCFHFSGITNLCCCPDLLNKTDGNLRRRNFKLCRVILLHNQHANDVSQAIVSIVSNIW